MRSRPRPALWALVFLAALAASCGPASPVASPPIPVPSESIPPATATPQSAQFRIVGYVTDWDASVSQIQFDKLTHINYAFILPRADGTINNIKNPWKLKEVVKPAQAHNVKVLISVGGWGWDVEFEALAAGPETRATFVAGLRSFVDEYSPGGVDIDWEYPDPGESAQNYLALMRELRAVLQLEGKLLTSAVVALGATGDGIPVEAFEVVDFLNLMAYDGSGPHHSSQAYAEESLEYWSTRGLAAEKTVLGVPFYARPGDIPYRKLVQVNPKAVNTDAVDHYGSQVYYNGVPTIQQKTELAMRRASGIMIWALSQDTGDSTSLLGAIYRTVHEPGQP